MQHGRYDCIVGGITITHEGERILAWSTLSLVNAITTPTIRNLADMKGAAVGVQAATTDYDTAVATQKRGEIGSVKTYAFDRIEAAMTDLEAGRIAAVMKVAPVAVRPTIGASGDATVGTCNPTVPQESGRLRIEMRHARLHWFCLPDPMTRSHARRLAKAPTPHFIKNPFGFRALFLVQYSGMPLKPFPLNSELRNCLWQHAISSPNQGPFQVN